MVNLPLRNESSDDQGKVQGKATKFFDLIGPVNSSTMEDCAKAFTERGKKEPDWVFATVLRFAQA
jgi:hypothetical protein